MDRGGCGDACGLACKNFLKQIDVYMHTENEQIWHLEFELDLFSHWVLEKYRFVLFVLLILGA